MSCCGSYSLPEPTKCAYEMGLTKQVLLSIPGEHRKIIRLIQKQYEVIEIYFNIPTAENYGSSPIVRQSNLFIKYKEPGTNGIVFEWSFDIKNYN